MAGAATTRKKVALASEAAVLGGGVAFAARSVYSASQPSQPQSVPPAPTELPGSSEQPIARGLRVLELATVVAAPVIGRFFADWGAEVRTSGSGWALLLRRCDGCVSAPSPPPRATRPHQLALPRQVIKVEASAGDTSRSALQGRLFDQNPTPRDVNAAYEFFNFGKASVQLDLTTTARRLRPPSTSVPLCSRVASFAAHPPRDSRSTPRLRRGTSAPQPASCPRHSTSLAAPVQRPGRPHSVHTPPRHAQAVMRGR